MSQNEETEVIIVGAGLAGLVAATELAEAGKRVIIVEQEGEQSLGGQAFLVVLVVLFSGRFAGATPVRYSRLL